MTTTPKALRSRNMTMAKRSLTLIRDAAVAALATLENGGVPDEAFAASVATYEKALAVLRTLDMLGEAAPPPGKGWLATVEVGRDNLDLLIHLLRQSDMAGVIAQAEDNSPIGKLLAAVEGEPEKEGN
jgi:hypothetical protein